MDEESIIMNMTMMKVMNVKILMVLYIWLSAIALHLLCLGGWDSPLGKNVLWIQELHFIQEFFSSR